MVSYAGIAAVVTLAVLGAAVLLAAKLQRIVSEPILALGDVARQISEQQDYSLRATKQGRDEIGVLTDDFNQMLSQIEKSDEALRASEERFRQMAENINEVFWLTDPEKTEMIYVSSAYEQIWGRPLGSLYAQPRSWLDSIHPADRERVLQAALTKQAGGDYDEEYRIVRPDRSVRWIRDRGFPIRDAAGAVYRVAGIAEDVTERKRMEREILEISEREQSRIGQDLHDGLCQHLVSVAFASNMLADKLRARALAEAADAQEISALVDDAITQSRQLARGLYPVKLEAEGLASALEELAASVSALFGVRCGFECGAPVTLSEHAAATHLYRIAQEAITNAIKHGNAKHITIHLAAAGDMVKLIVHDDGHGVANGWDRAEGMGLHIMRYRARMIGGTLHIERGAGGGAVVACSFQQKPLP